MHILVTNDDSIYAQGIKHLADALLSLGHQITVVAPDAPRSGASSQITSHLPLRLIHQRSGDGIEVYKCTGTPVDCIKLALNTLFAEQKPDLIASGINHGRNDGICVHYSGTVAAALEGAIAGIPAVAFSRKSAAEDNQFVHCTDFAKTVINWLQKYPLSPGTVLNINFPHQGSKGVKFVRQATGLFRSEFMQSLDPSGKPVYWMQGDQHDPSRAQDTDLYWLNEGYTVISPIQIDLTDKMYLQEMQQAVSELM